MNVIAFLVGEALLFWAVAVLSRYGERRLDRTGLEP